MNAIKIMVNGLPGNMARAIVQKALTDKQFDVIPYSLTGPEIEEKTVVIENKAFTLVPPDQKKHFIQDHKKWIESAIAIDYTHPTAVDHNCQWYCDNHIHFVLGTTGGNRVRIVQAVQKADICAVISPNMGKQIVGFQAMLAYAAKEFPGLFEGYSMEITESHQKGKADVSGTARSLIPCFQDLGADVHENDIFMERNPDIQHKQLGVPRLYLNGHAWHTYSLVSADQTVTFQFTHNVNGRSIYVSGTLDAAKFLHNKICQGHRNLIYTMIDVLKGN
ncbi:MAG: dihydrodipicolinate reductase [Candidatus Magnetoglobus multicellularis str. Araruama]|uniref:4-hydroxy-tetrahydrodipicolinate reductase n=1 Tax=Candidatus Magnetoglobus multicellularis str. Araruama TaxID=890399 RepID=A0A1V1PCT3_9BACT|nr:MAG: dihydrodipicolinate reductase [Candidatus Magnetoglobus multicellularis str. Araruama]